MEENNTVEVDVEIIKTLFEMAKLPYPEELSSVDLLNCLLKLKNDLANTSQDFTPEMVQTQEEMPLSTKSNNVLVIDDIGIVTYQLKVMLSAMGYNVHVAKDIFGGINIFVKSNYDFVIMDLFVSTEQEGYTLLHEVKKIVAKNNLATKIIVITASNKTENRVKCLNGGADYFVKKDSGWQDKIAQIVGEPSYI